MAGRDLTEYLMILLCEIGKAFETTAEKEIARVMKESLCFVAENFDKELEAA